MLRKERSAAEYLDVTTRALQKWRAEGGGPPYVRLGERAIRYDEADLREWVAQRKANSLAEERAAQGAEAAS